MSSLAALRTELTELLGALGAPVFGYLPGRFTPPVAVLVQGSPYVEQAETFGATSVRFDLVLIAGVGTNEGVTNVLDGLIEATYKLIVNSAQFFIEIIEQPALYQHGQSTYLSCVVGIRVDTRLET